MKIYFVALFVKIQMINFGIATVASRYVLQEASIILCLDSSLCCTDFEVDLRIAYVNLLV